MNRDEMGMIGFEIVAYAGEARSKLLSALKKAESGEYEEAEVLVTEAEESIANAHKAQTDVLAKEATGEDLDFSFIMMHGQDHLMTTILLKDMMHHMIALYKRG